MPIEIPKTNDKLIEFKIENLIESTFQLTPEESNLLQELFTYPLNSRLTMFDLIGFGLHDKLKKMKGIYPLFDEKITNLQDKLAARSILLIGGFYRAEPDIINFLGATNDYTLKFFDFPKRFLEFMDNEFSAFQQEINHLRPLHPTPTHTQQNLLNSIRNQLRDKFTNTILPLRNLYSKLFESRGYIKLMLQGLAKYQGHETLDQTSPKGRETVESYCNYIKTIFEQGKKWGSCGLKYKFTYLVKGLPFSPLPLKKEMQEFGLTIAQSLCNLQENVNELSQNLQNGMKRKIDHQTWLAENRLRSLGVKNQEQFIEQLFATKIHVMYLIGSITDILRLTEERVYPAGTLTTESCFHRLLNNVGRYQNHSLSAPPHINLPFADRFQWILKEIESNFENFPNFLDCILENYYEWEFTYSFWIHFLVPHEQSISNAYEKSLRSLADLKKDVIQDLTQQMSTLPLESLQKMDLASIKENLFQQGLQLLRPLLILSDMLALLQKQHYSEEAAIIPRELAELMEIEGLEELLEKFIQAKTPIPVKEVERAPGPKPVTPKPPKLTTQTKKAPAQIKQTPTVTSSPEAEILELAYLSKSREILKKLKNLNFFEIRQRGSHHILSGPKGGRVVVPKNDNLPRGTRHSIVEQALNVL